MLPPPRCSTQAAFSLLSLLRAFRLTVVKPAILLRRRLDWMIATWTKHSRQIHVHISKHFWRATAEARQAAARHPALRAAQQCAASIARLNEHPYHINSAMLCSGLLAPLSSELPGGVSSHGRTSSQMRLLVSKSSVSRW